MNYLNSHLNMLINNIDIFYNKKAQIFPYYVIIVSWIFEICAIW